MEHLLFISLISLMLIVTFSIIRKKIVNHNLFTFEGDISSMQPSDIAALRKLQELSGDFDEDLALNGDIYEPLAGALSLDNSDNRSALWGDIDEIEESIENDDDVAEGALFKKLKARRAAKKAKKSGFQPNLLGRKAIADVLKKETSVPVATAKINQIQALSQTPGALLSSTDVSKIQVTGGKMKQTETDLLIKGSNFANAVVLWSQYYPGLSRATTQVSAGANLTYTFVEPAAGEVTQVQVAIITLAGNDLNKIKNAEMSITTTGLGTDGVAIATTRDRVELFTDEKTQKTVIVFIPTKKIKEELFAVPWASPTTANPITIVLGGVPTGVNATVRLSGIDDEDWKSYKRMVGLS